MKAIDFEPITLRLQVSTRGGGVEIDLTNLGFPGEKMAAYQNYLGGGMLGAVQANDTIRSQSNRPFMDEDSEQKLDQIADQLKQYFHNLTNPDEEDQPWESQTYDQNQSMPSSAY